MSKIDWNRAGKRIRWQPTGADGRNPDFVWVESRWKDEADYYAEEMAGWEVEATTACPREECPSLGIVGRRCFPGSPIGLVDVHRERRRAAGEDALKKHGPRFTPS